MSAPPPPRSHRTLKRFSSKLLSVNSLKQLQGETKVRINSNLCQTLVDTGTSPCPLNHISYTFEVKKVLQWEYLIKFRESFYLNQY